MTISGGARESEHDLDETVTLFRASGDPPAEKTVEMLQELRPPVNSSRTRSDWSSQTGEILYPVRTGKL